MTWPLTFDVTAMGPLTYFSYYDINYNKYFSLVL